MPHVEQDDLRWPDRLRALALLYHYRERPIPRKPDKAEEHLRQALLPHLKPGQPPSRATLFRWTMPNRATRPRTRTPELAPFVRAAVLSEWRTSSRAERDALDLALAAVFDDDAHAFKTLFRKYPNLQRAIAGAVEVERRTDGLKLAVRGVHGEEPSMQEVNGVDDAVANVAVTQWAAGILHVAGPHAFAAPVVVRGHLARHLRRHYHDKVARFGLGLPVSLSEDGGRRVLLQRGSLELDNGGGGKGEVVARDATGTLVYRHRNRGTPPWEKREEE